LKDTGENELVTRLAGAVATVWAGLDTDALARDAGMARATLKAGLDAAFRRFTPAGIKSIIDAVRMSHHAFGADQWTVPHELFAIIGGRLPDPALTVVVTALALRIPVTLKPPTAHQAFIHALISGMKQADPLFDGCLDWIDRPKSDPVVQTMIADAAMVMVFGKDQTVAKVQALRPGRPTMVYGHREAVEVVAGPVLDGLFDAIARDIAMYDQAGCLSPHIVALKRDVMPAKDFSQNLYKALKTIEKKLPQKLSFEDAAGTRLFIQDMIQKDARLADPENLVPNVIFNGRRPFISGPGNRIVQVMGFSDWDDLFLLLKPLRRHIQGIAVYPDPANFARILQKNQDFAAWITVPGTLQAPPVLWPEDGRFMALKLTSPLKIS